MPPLTHSLHFSRVRLLIIPSSAVCSAGQLSQTAKRHVWFFALSDCDEEMHLQLAHGIRVKVEVTVKNTDQTHFSNDEEGFIWIYTVLIAFSGLFLALNVQKVQRYQRKAGERDWPHLLVILALTFFAISYFLNLVHLFSYSRNGEGIRPVELFAQIFEVAGECTVTMFLLLISWGWTINYQELQDLEVYIPLSVLVVVVHVIIIGLGKLTDDAHDKYHSYDGWVGIVMILIRLGMYGYFFWGTKETFTRARAKVKEFAQQLRVLGSVYFLAFPVIVIVSYIFDSYMRLSVVLFGSLFLQLSSVVLLSYSCTSSKSGYYSVSFKGQTLLPSEKID